MNSPTLIQIIGAALFGLAVIHTFSTKFFENLARTDSRHAGVINPLGLLIAALPPTLVAVAAFRLL